MAKDIGKKVAIGAVIAGTVGYVAGVLTAPKSGKETRRDIKNATVKAKTEAEKRLKELHSELNDKLAEAKIKGENLTGKAKEDFHKVLAGASTAKEKAREIISALHEGDVEDPDLKKALADAKSALKTLEKYVKS
jgi:gas vesicle protein